MKKMIKFVKGKKEDECNKVISIEQKKPSFENTEEPKEDDFLTSDKSITKVHKAVWQENSDKLKSIIKTHDIDITDKLDRTALYFAVLKNNAAIVQLLLEHEANQNIPDIDGVTPFLKSIQLGALDCAETLLARGADLKRADKDLNSCLHYAAGGSWQELLGALLDRGLDANARNLAGECPLHVAARAGASSSAQLLLARGAGVNAADCRGFTPLMLAAVGGYSDTALLLLGHNADRDMKDTQGRTAVDHAAHGGHTELAARIQDEPAPQLARISERLAPEDTDGSETSDNSTRRSETSSPQSGVIPPPCKPLRSLEYLQAAAAARPPAAALLTLGTVRTRHVSEGERPRSATPHRHSYQGEPPPAAAPDLVAYCGAPGPDCSFLQEQLSILEDFEKNHSRTCSVGAVTDHEGRRAKSRSLPRCAQPGAPARGGSMSLPRSLDPARELRRDARRYGSCRPGARCKADSMPHARRHGFLERLRGVFGRRSQVHLGDSLGSGGHTWLCEREDGKVVQRDGAEIMEQELGAKQAKDERREDEPRVDVKGWFCEDCRWLWLLRLGEARLELDGRDRLIALLRDQLRRLGERSVRSVADAQQAVYRHRSALADTQALRHLAAQYEDELKRLLSDRRDCCSAVEEADKRNTQEADLRRENRRLEDELRQLRSGYDHLQGIYSETEKAFGESVDQHGTMLAENETLKGENACLSQRLERIDQQLASIRGSALMRNSVLRARIGEQPQSPSPVPTDTEPGVCDVMCEVERLNDEYAEMHLQLQEAALQGSLETARAENCDLRDRLRDMERVNEELREEQAEGCARLEDILEENEQLKKGFEEMLTEIEFLRGELRLKATIGRQRSELEERLRQLQQEHDRKCCKVAALETERGEQLARLAELEESAALGVAERDTLEKRARTAENTAATLRSDLTGCVTALDELRAANQRLSTAAADISAGCERAERDAEQRIARISARLSSVDSENENLRAAVQDARTRCDSLAAKLESLTLYHHNEMIAKSARYDELRRDGEGARCQLIATEQERDRLRIEMGSIEEARRIVERQNAEMRTAVEVLRTILDCGPPRTGSMPDLAASEPEGRPPRRPSSAECLRLGEQQRMRPHERCRAEAELERRLRERTDALREEFAATERRLMGELSAAQAALQAKQAEEMSLRRKCAELRREVTLSLEARRRKLEERCRVMDPPPEQGSATAVRDQLRAELDCSVRRHRLRSDPSPLGMCSSEEDLAAKYLFQ